MPLMPLNQQLTDLGGIPVLWDSDLGTLVQDPTQGGTNRYGPGDLFRDPANGDVYQLGQDGSLALYRIGASAPTVPVTAGPNAVSSAGKSWTSSPTSTPAIAATGNPTQFGHQVVTWLSTASFIGGLPNGLLVALGLVGYSFMRQRRRRNPERPILRNPSGGPRVVYNRLLGGWYVVTGPHQTPISGRFDSKGEALEWLRGRRRNPGKGERLWRRAEAARRRREQLYVGPYIREQRAVMRRGLDGRLGRFERSYFLAQRRRRRR